MNGAPGPVLNNECDFSALFENKTECTGTSRCENHLQKLLFLLYIHPNCYEIFSNTHLKLFFSLFFRKLSPYRLQYLFSSTVSPASWVSSLSELATKGASLQDNDNCKLGIFYNPLLKGLVFHRRQDARGSVGSRSLVGLHDDC